MAKKREPVDDVLDAIVWMRRKSKHRKSKLREPVDDFIDALLTMRQKTRKKKKKTQEPAAAKPKKNAGIEELEATEGIEKAAIVREGTAADAGQSANLIRECSVTALPPGVHARWVSSENRSCPRRCSARDRWRARLP